MHVLVVVVMAGMLVQTLCGFPHTLSRIVLHADASQHLVDPLVEFFELISAT